MFSRKHISKQTSSKKNSASLNAAKTRYQSISKLSFKKWQKHRKEIAVKSHNNRYNLNYCRRTVC